MGVLAPVCWGGSRCWALGRWQGCVRCASPAPGQPGRSALTESTSPSGSGSGWTEGGWQHRGPSRTGRAAGSLVGLRGDRLDARPTGRPPRPVWPCAQPGAMGKICGSFGSSLLVGTSCDCCAASCPLSGCCSEVHGEEIQHLPFPVSTTRCRHTPYAPAHAHVSTHAHM